MTWYNQTRQVEELLAKTEAKPPSFTVHLHAEHWVLNNGSKFLYNNYAASLLDDIRAHQLPVDFLDLFDASPNIHFYDGCLIAELLDYRPLKANDPPLEKPGRTRTVLHPTPESLWADVCKIAATKKQQEGLVMTDRDALEIESRILLATAPPLCLDPDPHLTRMVNHIVRVSTPTVPTSLKRKASAVDQEEDETDKARRAKIMQFMNSRATRVPSANYRILDAIQRSKQAKESKGTDTPQPQQPPVTVAPSTTQSPAPSTTETPAPQLNPPPPPPPPVEQEDPAKPKPKPKTEPPPTQITFAKPAVPPHPPPATHQFHAQNQTTKASNTPSPRTRTPLSFPAQENVPRISTPSKQQQPSHNQSPRVQQQAPQATQPAKAQTPHPVTYQPPIQNQTQFIHQNPATNTRVNQTKAAAAAAAHNQNTSLAAAAAAAAVRSATPAQPQQHNVATVHLTPAQQQHMIQQHIMQQRILQQQQQQQQSGRASTTPTAQGNAMHGTPVPARATPMVTNQRIASRSPMPPQPQVQAQQATPQMAHPQQPQINFQQYNTAAAAQYRTLAHPNTASPRPQPTNVANRGAQPNADASTQQPQQAQIHYAPQMYGYTQMPPQMNYRMPMNTAYWMNMRPGMVVNGQIHGIQPNQQQQQQQQQTQQAQQMMMQMKPPANTGR